MHLLKNQRNIKHLQNSALKALPPPGGGDKDTKPDCIQSKGNGLEQTGARITFLQKWPRGYSFHSNTHADEFTIQFCS